MTGLVIRARSGRFDVRLDDGAVLSAVPRKGLFQRTGSGEPVVVGDRVLVSGDVSGDPGTVCAIDSVEPRRNQMSRSSVRSGGREKVLAANLDRIFVVASLEEPDWKPGAVDRYLVLAEARAIPAAIVFHKLDLVPEAKADPQVREYLHLSYPVLFTSVKTDAGREELEEMLAGAVSLLVGPSGSGKSSLASWVTGATHLPTAALSAATGKGVHTTSWVELVPTSRGGYLVDSPGIRSIGLYGVDRNALPGLYPEFRVRAPSCRFRSCTHRSEPDCAVRGDLGAGVSPLRYQNYLRIFDSFDTE